MTSAGSEFPATHEHPGPRSGALEALGRAWIGPALLLAGFLALARVEILAHLAVEVRGVEPSWARWEVLADWPAQVVQGLIMGAAATAVVWSARGARSVFAVGFGALILTSALTGWPAAEPSEIAVAGSSRVPAPWFLGAGCLVLAAALGGLAWVSSRSPVLTRAFESKVSIAFALALGLGVPSWKLWQQAQDAPHMRAAAGEMARTRSSREATNLVLIAIDGLRADRASCYGANKLTTPALDRLAQEGRLFERAYSSSSSSLPSVASLLTALDGVEHGVSETRGQLDERFITLPEALQQIGFTTAAIIANPELSVARGFAQGFETYDARAARRSGDAIVSAAERELQRFASVRFFLFLQLSDPLAPRTSAQSLLERSGEKVPEGYAEVGGLEHYAERLRAGEGRDVLGAPHPLQIVPAQHAQWIWDEFDASLALSDQALGRFLSRLEDSGLAERTVVVVTGTHGEELLEHGLLGHGHGLWNELVRVPLVIAGPGIERGQRVALEVSNFQLASTLARLAGTQLGHATEAIDLLDSDFVPAPILTRTTEGVWNGESGVEIFGWRGEHFSLQVAPSGARRNEAPTARGDTLFFATEGDPGEDVDLTSEALYQAEAASARAALEVRLEVLRERAEQARDNSRRESP